MSRDSGGTYSLPAGNPVVTGTTISSATHNTTNSDIGTELTDSLSRSGKGAMLAPLELTNGSAAAPSLTFDSDTDTGLYRIGADNLGLAVGGTKAVDVAAGTVTVPLGLTVTQDTANGAAVTATGNGSGAGVSGTGGATGPGVSGTGGGSAAGGSFANGTAATGGTRQDAAKLTNGDLDMSGVAYPDTTTGVTNRLTPAGLIKVYGTVATDGAGAVSVRAGSFNVASASISTVTLTITIANDMADTLYGVIATIDGAQFVGCTSKQVGQFDIKAYTRAGVGIDFAATVATVSFIVMGVQ